MFDLYTLAMAQSLSSNNSVTPVTQLPFMVMDLSNGTIENPTRCVTNLSWEDLLSSVVVANSITGILYANNYAIPFVIRTVLDDKIEYHGTLWKAVDVDRDDQTGEVIKIYFTCLVGGSYPNNDRTGNIIGYRALTCNIVPPSEEGGQPIVDWLGGTGIINFN